MADTGRVDALRQTDEAGGDMPAKTDAQQYSAIDLDNWWSDAPMTDRQLDVLQGEIDNRLIPEGAHFHKQVVRKLLGEVKRQRNDRIPLCDEYGMRVTYISTRQLEATLADTAAGARAVIAQLDNEDRSDVVSRVPIQRKVGDWQELGVDD